MTSMDVDPPRAPPSPAPANFAPTPGSWGVSFKRVPTMDATWRALVNDPNKLDSLVESMSRCIGRVLSLKNDEVKNGKMSLGQALYDEIECFPSRGQLEELEIIRDAFGFVLSAFHVSSRLRKETEGSVNVDLQPFLKEKTFGTQGWTFQRPRGDGVSNLVVGGMRSSLYKDVKKLVAKWLGDCDQAMMLAFDDMGPRDFADDSKMSALIQETACGIAARITLMPKARSCEEELSTRSLEARAAEEIERTAMMAQESVRSELIALRTLEILAQHGATTYGREIFETKIAHVQYIVNRPRSIFPDPSTTASVGLDLLARACMHDLDIDVRMGIVNQWFQCHGAAAATAAGQCIQKLRTMHATQWKKPFIKVLQLPSETPSRNGTNMPMPRIPVVKNSHQWRFVANCDQHADRYDWIARRAVRLSSLVVQLLGHDALKPGLLSSQIVSPMATQACVESRMVLELLNIKRESYSLGTNLLKFCEDVSDTQSHLADEVGEALLNVSQFSTLELLSIFDTQSPALRVIMNEFSVRTRSRMTSPLPVQYNAFAYDAMAVVLPIIRARRETAGRPITQRCDPVCALLRELPVVSTWSPLQGQLKLTADDLKQAPRLLQAVLQALCNRGVLVEYKRPYLGGYQKAARKAYVFDTPQLVELLGGRPLGGVRPE